jgi:hypothetical protein
VIPVDKHLQRQQLGPRTDQVVQKDLLARLTLQLGRQQVGRLPNLQPVLPLVLQYDVQTLTLQQLIDVHAGQLHYCLTCLPRGQASTAWSSYEHASSMSPGLNHPWGGNTLGRQPLPPTLSPGQALPGCLRVLPALNVACTGSALLYIDFSLPSASTCSNMNVLIGQAMPCTSCNLHLDSDTVQQ